MADHILQARRVALAGASLMSMLASGTAYAQAAPGDPNCPKSGTEVTCTGNLGQGIVVVTADTVETLTVRDLAAPIAPTAGNSGVDFIRTNGPVRIDVAASARGISVTGDANGIEAYAYDADINLRNAAPITGRSTAASDLYGIRTWVYEVAGSENVGRSTIAIANSGVIDLRLAHTTNSTRNVYGISARIEGNGELRITNDGAITAIEGPTSRVIAYGIDASMTGRETLIEIVNNAAITLNNPQDGRGISLGLHGLLQPGTSRGVGRVTNNAPITGIMGTGISASGVVTGGVTGFTDLIVTNNAVIDIDTQSTFGQAIGVIDSVSGNFVVTNNADLTVRGGGGGIDISVGAGFRDYANYVPGFITLRNSGNIVTDGSEGISASGDKFDVINTGDVTVMSGTVADAISVGEWNQILGESGFRGNIANVSRLENDGDLKTAGTAAYGIRNYLVGSGITINRGDITTTGADANGIWTQSLTSASVTNSGTIRVSGAGAIGVEFAEYSVEPATTTTDPNFDRARDLASALTLNTTAEIIAAGADGIGIRIDAGRGTFGSPSTTFLETGYLGTSSVRIDGATVSGGSGAGAGLVYLGRGTNTLDNRGTVTALSGRAITGDLGAEIILNRGAILGSIALGGGSDTYRHLPGGSISGAIDLGDGDDSVTVTPGTVLSANLAGGSGQDRLVLDITGISRRTDFATGILASIELLEKNGAGTLLLEEGGFERVLLNAGTLQSGGAFGSTAVSAADSTAIVATGSLGAVTLADNASLAPGGNAVAALSLAALTLSANSRIELDLGVPGQVGGADNDLITVTGNLVLDGNLDINARPGFGDGVYRLINYSGGLTDNGLSIGAAPARGYQIQTAAAGQINLVVGQDVAIQFWDGAATAPDGVVEGGGGTWSAGATNWTNAAGTINTAWAGNFAVFQGTGGAVVVDGAQNVGGMQFTTNGYRLSGGSLALTAAQTAVRTDPGVTAELALPVSGTGTLVKRDAGTLIMSGANSYSGGTTIGGGIVQISSDGALGTGGVTLDGGTLRAGGPFTLARTLSVGPSGGTLDTDANTLAMTAGIGGTGTLSKLGGGTLQFSGAGASFAGILDISAGELRHDGALGGTVRVGSGARLSGTGTLGNLVVAGTLAPGNSIGTLTAGGNVTFAAGSTFAVELAASGATDRLSVAGTATLQGGTVAVTALDPETQYANGTRYTFLSAAGGLTGTFASLTENSAFLDFALGYDANNAFVTVAVVRTFPDVARTFNQTQTAGALRNFGQGAAGSDSLAIYNAILLLDESSARAAFNASSGEIYAVQMGIGQRQGGLLAASLLARGNERGSGWGIWGGISGQSGRVRGDGNGARFAEHGTGLDGGLDYRTNRWAAGIGGGYLDGAAKLPGRVSRSDYEGWQIGGYARFGSGKAGFTARAAANYVALHADVSRAISIGALSRIARSNVDSGTTTLAADLQYGFAGRDGWAFGPSARIVRASADLQPFAETGAGSLNVAARKNRADNTRYGPGVFGNWQGERGWLRASAHYLASKAAITEVTLDLNGSPYALRSAAGDSDVAAWTLAGEYALGKRWTFGAQLDGELSSNQTRFGGTAKLSWRF